jgi:hypothetical protein
VDVVVFLDTVIEGIELLPHLRIDRVHRMGPVELAYANLVLHADV